MIINLFINITKYGDHNINDVSMNDSPTVKDIKYLKHLYFKENSTSDIIKYGNIDFLMNSGDYMKPIL